MDVCYKAAMETYADLSAKSPAFKKIYDHQQAFKKDAYLWAQIAEYSYDTYMMTQQRAGAL
ncbi:TRAP-type mannitol/chloroaromatic compound transport system%2C periplasmic component [Mycobacterium tuberculosis]|nr:TRAP-type mannitol/chloroaromatic compound transport system%2C periplasmic component [Mycobacterium tuberculosis]